MFFFLFGILLFSRIFFLLYKGGFIVQRVASAGEIKTRNFSNCILFYVKLYIGKKT